MIFQKNLIDETYNLQKIFCFIQLIKQNDIDMKTIGVHTID